MSLADDRAQVRRDLDAILESVEVLEASPEHAHLRGAARFGSTLTGPPARLHGGLHAYARVFPVLARVPCHDPGSTFPCRVTLDLYRALHLEQSVPFEARYTRSTSGAFALDVIHDGTERLRSRAESVDVADARLAWFREAHAVTRGIEPLRTIRAQGDVPMHVHPALVVMPMDRAMRVDASPTFAKFAEPDGRIDLAAICVAADLLGAVTQGYAWRAPIYTVRIDFVLEAASIAGDVDLVLLADRRGERDTECPLANVALPDGGEGGPTKIRILLADASLERAYVHGTLTIVPARLAR